MSRYRKIEVRTWSDDRFRALSKIQPSGQGLWFYLLTGPHTTAIPGLFHAGRAAMAEALEWEQEAFDKAFAEVSTEGMAKADFKARLVWLPKAIRYNKPESPNVVRGWRVELDLLPECDLKREAIAGIREALICVGSSYVEAFDEVLSSMPRNERPKSSAKPSAKPLPKTMPNQEQEQDKRNTPRKRGPAAQVVSVETMVSEGVDPQNAADWLTARKVKRLPLTPTAWARTKAEAAKAGIGVPEAIKTAAAKGWGGFEASWLTPEVRRNGDGRGGGELAEIFRRGAA